MMSELQIAEYYNLKKFHGISTFHAAEMLVKMPTIAIHVERVLILKHKQTKVRNYNRKVPHQIAVAPWSTFGIRLARRPIQAPVVYKI